MDSDVVKHESFPQHSHAVLPVLNIGTRRQDGVTIPTIPAIGPPPENAPRPGGGRKMGAVVELHLHARDLLVIGFSVQELKLIGEKLRKTLLMIGVCAEINSLAAIAI